MSINAIIDGTTYEGVETIIVGGKTITLNEVEDGEPSEYPTVYFFNGANPSYLQNLNKYGLEAAVSYTNTRASAYLDASYNGGVKYENYSDTIYSYPEPSYPLYIPEGATKITVSCTGLCCAINVHKDLNGSATLIDSGSWSNVGGVTNYDLTSYISQGATHVSIGFKNSSNTSLANTTIDATTVSISFS